MAVAALAGAVLSLAAVIAFDVGRFAVRSDEPSTIATNVPMTPQTIDPSWILSGSPTFLAGEISRSPDGRSDTGLWSCQGPTTFVWKFGIDETVHLLEGEVKVKYLGKSFTLTPGDTALFHAKTEAEWTIDRYAKKVYTHYDPGPIGRQVRKHFPAGG